MTHQEWMTQVEDIIKMEGVHPEEQCAHIKALITRYLEKTQTPIQTFGDNASSVVGGKDIKNRQNPILDDEEVEEWKTQPLHFSYWLSVKRV